MKKNLKQSILTVEERNKLAAENRKKIKNGWRLHKKVILISLIAGGIIGGIINIQLYQSFVVNKIEHESLDSQAVVECFYNAPCKQKITNLSLEVDKTKIVNIATAYEIKKFLDSHPEHYKTMSLKNRNHIDEMLELTK
ncbi:MAG: hypothetical protein K2Q03_01505 [Sphingobacteriaceae bacterium]|nr:hypothetical protein [Sphingobacteriaceae bacterium]